MATIFAKTDPISKEELRRCSLLRRSVTVGCVSDTLKFGHPEPSFGGGTAGGNTSF
jgi:hypothetical protein